jgi:hypothetical protein
VQLRLSDRTSAQIRENENASLIAIFDFIPWKAALSDGSESPGITRVARPIINGARSLLANTGAQKRLNALSRDSRYAWDQKYPAAIISIVMAEERQATQIGDRANLSRSLIGKEGSLKAA